jgi:prolyl 4-hydroxylase
LLKYDNGNKFHKHHDDKIDGHTRLYTAVIYLNDDCIGGETHFPEVGLTIKPKKGKLLLFKNIVDGVLNPKSLHESYQIKKGTKHALVNWVWID